MYRPRGYAELKAEAKASGQKITDLLALARANDPFYAGSPGQRAMAEWFGEIWQRFGYTTGVHLRRVHYQLVSQRDPHMYNGERYENTERCWGILCTAAKYARYLGLVSATAFEDHRNPKPHMYLYTRWDDAIPNAQVLLEEWEFPAIATELANELDWEIPDPTVDGYDYMAADQPVHLEVWVEKSTMNDVLEPICRRYGANLVTSLGFQSVTGTIQLLKRIEEHGQPARILYISDFDPAGDGMPAAVARQIEFWMEEYCQGIEIKLEPIALTADQVAEYDLPRIPVKDSDMRKAGWIERRGAGAVELDALEALHPGALRDIVQAALDVYYDHKLARALRDAGKAAQEDANRAWDDDAYYVRQELDATKEEVAAVLETYRERLEALAAELEAELEPLKEEVASLRERTDEKADQYEVELPDRPEGEVEIPYEAEWLFDSDRPFDTQLEVYHARKAGERIAR